MHCQLANANVLPITHVSGMGPAFAGTTPSAVIASGSEAIQLSSLWLVWIASLALAMTGKAAYRFDRPDDVYLF